jgi:hypothetical protein
MAANFVTEINGRVNHRVGKTKQRKAGTPCAVNRTVASNGYWMCDGETVVDSEQVADGLLPTVGTL